MCEDDFGISLTDQSYKDDCDINTLLERFTKGDMSVVRNRGVFADVSKLGDFQHNLETIRQAQRDFDSLPSSVRERFGHDPAALVEFLSNPENDAEAVKLGLKEYREVVKPVEPVKDVVTPKEDKTA